MKNFLSLMAMLFLISCMGTGKYQYFSIPKIEECRFLSETIFCKDSRLTNSKLNQIIQSIDANQSIEEVDKEVLKDYFETNRKYIVKAKEFEISLEHKGFFRGYLLVPAQDEKELKNFIDDKLRLLDRYIDTYGPFKTQTKSLQEQFPFGPSKGINNVSHGR